MITFLGMTKPPPTDWEKSKEYWERYSVSAEAIHRAYLEAPIEGPKREYSNWFEEVMLGTPSPATAVEELETIWKDKPERAVRIRKSQIKSTLSQVNRSRTLAQFYAELPVISLRVTSYSDYIELFPNTITEDLTYQDIADMNEALGSARREDELPDWLEVSTEEETKVREFLAQKPTPPPLSLQRMTTDELLKALPAKGEIKAPDMSEEELLRIVSILDLPPETLDEVIDIDDYIKVRSEADLELKQQIDDIKAGLAKWEIPDKSFGEKLAATVSSPMQQLSFVINIYLRNVSYPLAGTVARLAGNYLSVYDIDRAYNEARAQGIDPWHAAGVAWEDCDSAWYWKLPFELAVDPITWIPGWGLSKPAAMLSKVGLRRSSSFLTRVNKGFYSVVDIPFDAMKSFQSTRMLKTSSQLTRTELNRFNQTVELAAIAHTEKPFHLVTKEDLGATLIRAIEAYKANPKAVGDVFSDLGAYLAKNKAMTENKIYLWSRRHGGQLTETMDAPIVSEVNGILSDHIAGTFTAQQNAKRMARALLIEETPENIAILVKELKAYASRLATNVELVIGVGKAANLNPVARMMEYMSTRQRAIIESWQVGKQASGSYLEGMALALQRKVDMIENWRYRQIFDRYIVKPFAEANLGSVSYPIWNAFEGISVSLIEGVTPRFLKQEAYAMMVKGLRSDPGLALHLAAEPAAMIGATEGRRAGAWTMLPSGKFLGWLGRNYLEISNWTGNSLRRNFVTEKMVQYLAERAYKLADGDVMLAMERLVKNPPRVSKQTLGLSSHELEQELFRRLTVSADDALALKSVLTDGFLMQGEMEKILRKATFLSPRAKALGSQMIAEGKVLRDVGSIDNFVRQMADTTIEDLRKSSRPTEVADSFRSLADTINNTPVKTRNNLMELFTHYETMSETAAYIPHRMMYLTMDEEEVLYQANKFGAVNKLWKRSRQDMLDAIQEAESSLEVVRNKLLANSGKLTPKQRIAMESVLERSSASNIVRETTLIRDGEMLDAFFAGPKKPPEEYKAFRARRHKLWETYKQESAIPSAGEFITRRDLNKLYHGLPEPKLTPVDASSRSLSFQDVANVFGVNIDGLISGILDNISLHGKPYFVQLVKQSAEAKPSLFKGFTEEKIARVYDDILAQSRMRPDVDIGVQKVMQQAEGIRQDLISLKMRHSLLPDEESALHAWIDKAVAGRKEIIGEAPTGVPTGKAPAVPKAMISPDDWNKLRQASLDDALKDYYKTFPDYTNESIVGGLMKMAYPYWSYHSYRWFFLTRTALRHPGVPISWGKYHNYGENGFLPTYFPDIEMNPFVGSVLGTTFTLTRFDFASYYDQLGYAGEMLDYSQRFGFFPNALIMAPIALTPYISGRPTELGEIAPPIFRSGINAFVASNIPGVSDAAIWLKDHIFHENFHEYYTATILNSKQIESGGKLLIDPDTNEPVTGMDIWFKRIRGEKLSDEEQSLWDECYREAAMIGILRSQFPQFRLRTEEYKDAYKQVTQLIEQELGMSEDFQMELWRNHQRPTDVLGTDYPLDLRMALDEIWQWKIMMGRGTILMPPDISDLKALVDDYLNHVRTYQQDRLQLQASTNDRFLHPETTTDPLDGKGWRNEYSDNWSDYTAKVDSLKKDRKFADAVYALTPEGRQEAFKRLGFNIPPSHPLDEAMELYFEIELEKKIDPLSGEEDWDYLGFWLKREAVRMALTEEQRLEFDRYIRRYQTPMEETFRYAYNTYIRGYQASNRVVFQTFTDEEQLLIKEFYARATTTTRKEEIREVLRADGLKLIAQYQAKVRQARENLRTASPHLEFYLAVFGYLGDPPAWKTDEARVLMENWEADRTSILL